MNAFFGSIKDNMHSTSLQISDFVAGVTFEFRTLCFNHLNRFCLGLISSYDFFSHFGGA